MDEAPSKVPANPLLSVVAIGGFLLILAGVGSTLFGTLQKNQDVQSQIDMAVQEALAKQQSQFAECVNNVFDGKPAASKRRNK